MKTIQIIIVLLICNVALLMAQQTTDDKTLSPYFMVKSDSATVEQMPLKSTSAQVTISGVMANVVVNQTYVNSGKTTLEAIYVFPASTRAAVYGMKMIVGKRVMFAKIKEKEQARRDYEQAKKEGKTASLLEQNRPNVFTMSVGNILPGDTISVELSYCELLTATDGIYEFVYPTVVGPRYSNQKAETAPDDDKFVANPYLHQGEQPNYSFDIKVNLHAGMPVSKVACNTHKTNILFEDTSNVSIALASEEKYGGNRDYILHYQLKGKQIETGLLLNEGNDENFFLLMVQPPERFVTDEIPPREYVFIVDVSGSMSGFPLSISKKLFRDLISSLRPDDKFNVVLFAGGSEVLSKDMLPASSENLDKAILFIDNQQGGGGTEILSALKTAFDLPRTENTSRTFVIATDGYVDVERESFALIRNNLGKANVFAFGIGTSVNRAEIESIAKAGMAEPFVVTSELEAPKMADKFREYISSPLLTNIQISYQNFDAYDVEPVSLPDVMANRPILVYGKCEGRFSGKIILSGFKGDKQKYQKEIVVNSRLSTNNPSLPYLWARKRIETVSDFNPNPETTQKQVIDLGLKYNLLTQYTSFVAIDSLVRNKDGKYVAVKQPLPLPQGVSDYAVGGDVEQQEVSKFLSGRVPGVQVVESKELQLAPAEKIVEEEEEPVYVSVEEPATFQGGDLNTFHSYLQQKVEYPVEAAENNLFGKVTVQFTVDKRGNIINVKILRGVHPILDNAVLEAFKKIASTMKWSPAKQGGKAVAQTFVMPIVFNLEDGTNEIQIKLPEK
jgi:Ca-activated chloride channel family protein